MAKKRQNKPRLAKPVETPNEASAKLLVLDQLAAHPGWKVVLDEIEGSLASIEQRILSKKDEAGNLLDEAQIDRLRDRREDLLKLKDLPARFKAMLERGENAEDDDPYDR